MAETENKDEVIKAKEKTLSDDVQSNSNSAPIKDKPGGDNSLDTEDVDAVLEVLNYMDKEVLGGKGAIGAIPDELKGMVNYLVDKFEFVRTLWEDPKWEAILDDLVDQKEDGQTPSVDVAIVRTTPLAKLQELAESEDYEGTQTSLSDSLVATKEAEDEEAMYIEGFEKMQNEAQIYAEEMGYDESRKNQLLQKVFDTLKMFGDGKLTKAELAEFDKMINYDTDTASLREQLSTQGSKEVLPDKASLDATIAPQMPKAKTPASEPGLGSMANYGEPPYLKTGKKRFNKA